MSVHPALHDVVAGLLHDERLLRACATRDMGAVFRLLNTRGLSTRRIAAVVEISQGRLYDYMNGKTRVEKLALFEQIADALHIPGALLGLARRPWEPEVAPEPPLSAGALPVRTAMTWQPWTPSAVRIGKLEAGACTQL